MGIPLGAELHFVHGSSVVTVNSAKRVRFNGEEISLTAATRQLLAIEYSVQPSPYWTYQGKRLNEIYEETYGDVDEA